jgi:small GTP-binding protein
MAVPNVKCVVVGSHGVGKTSLLMTYQNKSFATNIPAVLEGYAPDVTVDGKQAKIALWDTAGRQLHVTAANQLTFC